MVHPQAFWSAIVGRKQRALTRQEATKARSDQSHLELRTVHLGRGCADLGPRSLEVVALDTDVIEDDALAAARGRLLIGLATDTANGRRIEPDCIELIVEADPLPPEARVVCDLTALV